MNGLKRCPVCHLVPTFNLTAGGLWIGGCQSGDSRICMDLKSIVLQPDLIQAQAQWNYVVEIFEPVLEMVA